MVYIYIILFVLLVIAMILGAVIGVNVIIGMYYGAENSFLIKNLFPGFPYEVESIKHSLWAALALILLLGIFIYISRFSRMVTYLYIGSTIMLFVRYLNDSVNQDMAKDIRYMLIGTLVGFVVWAIVELIRHPDDYWHVGRGFLPAAFEIFDAIYLLFFSPYWLGEAMEDGAVFDDCIPVAFSSAVQAFKITCLILIPLALLGFLLYWGDKRQAARMEEENRQNEENARALAASMEAECQERYTITQGLAKEAKRLSDRMNKIDLDRAKEAIVEMDSFTKEDYYSGRSNRVQMVLFDIVSEYQKIEREEQKKLMEG